MNELRLKSDGEEVIIVDISVNDIPRMLMDLVPFRHPQYLVLKICLIHSILTLRLKVILIVFSYLP